MNPLGNGTNFERTLYLFVALGLFIIGCSRVSHAPSPPAAPVERRLVPTGYTIQVGAFANLDNAVGFTGILNKRGIDAYHFIDDSGLYKVRFGNYPTRQGAEATALRLKNRGTITSYYIISPQKIPSESALRRRLVKTAEKFIGIPYKWGGDSPEEGFDCSGLTMTVYQLNGLNLPRVSRQQWQVGTPIKRHQIQEGDLVFFTTAGNWRISHVGIYVGDNRFIHAPGRGSKIRTAKLTNQYYQKHYAGARRYL